MNTQENFQSTETKQISLNASETIHLERPKAGEYIEISIKTGFIRIGADEENNARDLTLAFACKADNCEFNYPHKLDIKVEALTDTIYIVRHINGTKANGRDTIFDWVIQLHIVRQEVNLENRLMKLFYLLVTRLGKRTARGLLLEHTLSHARIAEIVGSTRSTISRTISMLRKTERIYIDDLKDQLILPAED